ncbi:Uu.00g027850.m01.CDS01 [Anthostomella pinea]|uniref:Uu.00g027850.m01.CDS01 n=1 Tax=Anthostomella pinea TaxID=933095 RepID=A0AAI8V8D6_9PEZI|nr:Uu.00g027850.m01.CDS01 [Anthostomella pinea]
MKHVHRPSHLHFTAFSVSTTITFISPIPDSHSFQDNRGNPSSKMYSIPVLVLLPFAIAAPALPGQYAPSEVCYLTHIETSTCVPITEYSSMTAPPTTIPTFPTANVSTLPTGNFSVLPTSLPTGNLSVLPTYSLPTGNYSVLPTNSSIIPPFTITPAASQTSYAGNSSIIPAATITSTASETYPAGNSSATSTLGSGTASYVDPEATETIPSGLVITVIQSASSTTANVSATATSNYITLSATSSSISVEVSSSAAVDPISANGTTSSASYSFTESATPSATESFTSANITSRHVSIPAATTTGNSSVSATESATLVVPIESSSSAATSTRSSVSAPFPTSSGNTTAPPGVTIHGFNYAGTGCSDSSVSSYLSPDKSTLTLAYDDFVAQSGPNLTAAEARKNCQLNVALTYPGGWQFTVFKADFRGYAGLATGIEGAVRALYYFSGQSQQVASTQFLQGPINANFIKTDQFNLQSEIWSPCGQEASLNINAEIRIDPLVSENPGLMTYDSTDLKFTQVQYLVWQQCTE